jgi:hypothetical protein
MTEHLGHGLVEYMIKEGIDSESCMLYLAAKYRWPVAGIDLATPYSSLRECRQ